MADHSNAKALMEPDLYRISRLLVINRTIDTKNAVCSRRLKRDTLLPLLEHAIAYLHEFRVRFNIGLQIL
jgi:hypothetical protein